MKYEIKSSYWNIDILGTFASLLVPLALKRIFSYQLLI